MRLGFPFVPFPREIWEKDIDLSKAEFRLLGWFLAGLRLGVQQDGFTDEEILSGNNRMPSVGLSRNAMKEARDGLTKKGMLKCDKIHYHGRWTYTLPIIDNLSENDTSSVTDRQSKCQTSPDDLSEVDSVIRKERTTDKTVEKKKRTCTLPEDFQPSESNRAHALREGVDLDRALTKFKANHRSKGSRFVDWHDALTTWILRDADYGKSNGKGNGVDRHEQQINHLRATRAAAHEILRRREEADQQNTMDYGPPSADVRVDEQAGAEPGSRSDDGSGSSQRVVRRTTA
jgi:hypothetical protein